MISESTDRSINDTNANVPRVIARGSHTFTNFTAFGTRQRSIGTIVLGDVLASSNPIIDCYDRTNAFFQRMNFGDSVSGNLTELAFFYLSTTTHNGNEVIQLNLEKISGGAETTAYYIVYSSKFTNEVVF